MSSPPRRFFRVHETLPVAARHAWMNMVDSLATLMEQT